MGDKTRADGILRFAKWYWLLIIPFVISLFLSIAPTPAKDFTNSVLSSALTWLFVPLMHRIITLVVLGSLVALPLIAWGMRGISTHTNARKSLQRYLRSIIEKNEDIKPTGFAQSETLLSVSVPLSDVFIQLRAVSDRPRYDLPGGQRALIEDLSRNTHLSAEEREAQVQLLRAQWYSQMGHIGEAYQGQKVDTKDILQHLSAELPVAVILGAPGSGKSTTMRWLAFHMARACRASKYSLPGGLPPAQVPILIRISNYAQHLSAVENLAFSQYFKDHIAERYPDQPDLLARLRNEMEQGHCLFLFDGLDEVASDSLRRRVAENIATFISDYSPDRPESKRYNRFIITSRIVGYHADTFAQYAHYTLLDLAYEQIEAFLTNWCPAVERYQMKSFLSRKMLTEQQEQDAKRVGDEQRDRLLAALSHSPSIERLAVNPLMLTILALLQKSGKALPHRRVDLYAMVAHTLLANWNHETGRRVFPEGEIPLAEQMLSNLAYQLHTSDRLLTEREVKDIAREAMNNFYGHPANGNDIEQFIQTLRRTSGLFVESGQGLFSFMHRTFQEYYVALYLLRQTAEARKDFAQQHYLVPVWREPLLLAIAYKSGRTNASEWREASELILAIVDTSESCDSVLHRHLLFATYSLVDCEPWTIDHALQRRIADALFTLYGDSYGHGRFRELQEDIEKVLSLWLRGQPTQNSHRHALPPLLQAWRFALCGSANTARQEGAVHLLVALARDLPSLSELVLNALVPPLLQLANVVDISCPPESMQRNLPTPPAYPSSLKVEEYAFHTLCLLGGAGPAGWLHKAWFTWSNERPELLERLIQHSLELGYPLAPTPLPGGYTYSGPDVHARRKVLDAWQKADQHDLGYLQKQLLGDSDTVRFPHASLLKQMLDKELASPSTKQSWRADWNDFLQKEMASGRSATYAPCLLLRLLLSDGSRAQRESIANELMDALLTQGERQIQTLTVVSNFYLAELKFRSDFIGLRDPSYQEKVMGSKSNPDFMEGLLGTKYLSQMRDLSYVRGLLDLGPLSEAVEFNDTQYMAKMKVFLKQERLVEILCTALQGQASGSSSAVFLTLYGILAAYDTIPQQVRQPVQNTIQALEKQNQLLTIEQRLLLTAIARLIGTIPRSPLMVSPSATPEEWVMRLLGYIHAHRQPQVFTKAQIEEILVACADAREWFKKKTENGHKVYSVQEIAWTMIDAHYNMEPDAQQALVQGLDHDEAIVCAAAALLLKRSRGLSKAMREEAMKKIIDILADDQRSRRPLDPPDYEVWRLDEVLFETLKALADE
jgi:hypothetical protein